MNILFTESSPNIGGQELQAVAQMKALKKMGHSVLLVCRENSKIAFEASKFGIDITFALFRNSLHIPTVWRLLGIVHSFQSFVTVDMIVILLVWYGFLPGNIHSELSGKRHI